MFGYIRPYAGELKVCELERYRAAYCGLCRAMGEVTGQVSRLSLTYDLVFYACVRMAVKNTGVSFSACRCAAHPLKQRMIMDTNDELKTAAAVSAFLTEAKISDDIHDSRGIKRLAASVLKPEAGHMSSLAAKYLGGREAAERLSMYLDELSELEEAKCESADRAADVFGRAAGELFALGLDGEGAETARRIGYGAGKFSYICDAADDFSKDRKSGSYNPVLLGWGDLAADENGEMSEIVKDSIKTSVPFMLEDAGNAAMTLGEHPFTPVVKNIIFLGLPSVLDAVTGGKKNINKTPV